MADASGQRTTIRQVTSPPTVLILDQSGTNQLVVRYLAHLGYAVLETVCGEDALTIVRRRRPPIDLVLSDVVIVGMSGTELARWLLAEAPAPAIILLTNGDCLPGVGGGLLTARYPPVRVLNKPPDLDLLQEFVRAFLPPLLPVEEEPAAVAGGVG
jgi:two-component system, cell cycle sensor histidine kinase and response regulator CckA